MNDKKRLNSYEDLPLVLDVADIQRIMGISRASAYELVHTPGFPAFRRGRLIKVSKIAFFEWMAKGSDTNYGQQIDNLIRGAYGSKIKVFDQTIPRSVRAAEISAVGESIFQHDPKGKVAEAYQSLAKEVLADADRQRKLSSERAR